MATTHNDDEGEDCDGGDDDDHSSRELSKVKPVKFSLSYQS